MRAWAVLMAVGLVTAGCANISKDDPNAALSAVRVAPMGPGQWMIACVDSPLICARQANRSCPAGFDVVSNTTNAADFGRMTMIIKCRL